MMMMQNMQQAMGFGGGKGWDGGKGKGKGKYGKGKGKKGGGVIEVNSEGNVTERMVSDDPKYAQPIVDDAGFEFVGAIPGTKEHSNP